MTQDDRKLLLMDLCARLPYGVKCQYTSNGYKNIKKYFICNLIEMRILSDNAVIMCSNNHLSFYIHKKDLDVLKPYFRPMFSITEEEKEELNEITVINCNEFEGCSTLFDEKGFDWLNAHHFDYRGLIPKGLALEAPERMYNLKE